MPSTKSTVSFEALALFDRDDAHLCQRGENASAMMLPISRSFVGADRSDVGDVILAGDIDRLGLFLEIRNHSRDRGGETPRASAIASAPAVRLRYPSLKIASARTVAVGGCRHRPHRWSCWRLL